jgi:hypothetical protein
LILMCLVSREDPSGREEIKLWGTRLYGTDSRQNSIINIHPSELSKFVEKAIKTGQ